MNDFKLNIYEFETTNRNKYIFDNNTGSIIPSSDEISYIVNNFYKSKDLIIQELLQKFGANTEDILSAYTHVESLVKQGMFISNCHPVISNKNLSQNSILETPIAQLVLILTEACNMRCKYCIYSDYYPGIKTYSNQEMSIETALKAIDKYEIFCKKKVEKGFNKTPSITFYGGEPFLKFDIIKAVVNYCKQKDFKAMFYVTTNGTIMTDEMIDFIIENEINIMFSLDGNKENHDRNRVFINNEPTFDKVFENIKKFQNRKKQLGIQQLSIFGVTFDLDTDMEKVIEFFDNNHDLLNPYVVRYNKVGDFGEYYNNCDLVNNKLNTSFKNLYNRFQNVFSKGDKKLLTPALKSLYSNLCLLTYKQKFINTDRKELCIPGTKIAVAPDENLYVCERVNQACPIGNLDDGLSMDKVNHLCNQFIEIINKECCNCNLSRLCDVCYSHMINEGDLCFNKDSCQNYKQSIKNSLSFLYSLLEEYPDKMKEFFNI